MNKLPKESEEGRGEINLLTWVGNHLFLFWLLLLTGSWGIFAGIAYLIIRPF